MSSSERWIPRNAHPWKSRTKGEESAIQIQNVLHMLHKVAFGISVATISIKIWRL